MPSTWDTVWQQTIDNKFINLDVLRSEQHLLLTQGLPASGKTTFAHVLVEWCEREGISMTRVNRDDIRRELGFKFDPKREQEVSDIQNDRVMCALANGENVICDDTYLNPAHISNRMFQAGQIEGANIHVHIIDWFIKHVSVQECIKRDLKRENYVGKDVIESLYFRYWKTQKIPPNSGPELAVMCDLDGTLAMFKGNPYERDFMADKANAAVAAVLDMASEKHTIILTSGRSAKYRATTEEWLAVQDIPYHQLIMRYEGDTRKDTVVKKEMYLNHIQGQYKVRFVLDDRPSVVRMWRAELGLTVFQVGPNMEF